MKPQWVIALILALVCTLTACTAYSRQADAAEETHEPLTIVSLFPEMDHFIDKVHETYPEINIEVIPYAGGNTTAYLSAQLRSGDMPDIYLTTVYVPERQDLSGKLVDLSGYSFTNNYTASSLHEVSDDDAIYLLPTFFSCLGITYNQTLLDEHGWTLPTTLAELRELAPQVKAAGCRLALNQIALPGYGFQYLCNIMDTDFLNTLDGRRWQSDFLDGKATAAGSEGMRQAFSVVEEWRELGMLNDEGSWYDNNETKRMMAEGNTLFLLGSTNNITAEDSDDEFRLMPYLSEDGTKNAVILQVSRYIGLNKALEKSPQKLADALHVMEVLSTVEGMSSLNERCANSLMLPLKDYVIPETSYYKPVEDELYNGLTAPFLYSGWENIIVPIGDVGLEYIRGSATLEQLISAIDDSQQLLRDSASAACTTLTEKLTTDDCARLVGVSFCKAVEADLALISKNAYFVVDGVSHMNPKGVSGELFPLPVSDQELTSILPTGWRGNIQTVTLTGARVKELAETGYDCGDCGVFFPYELVKPDSLTLQDEAVYTVVIAGVTDRVAAEGGLTDTGILGLAAARDYLSQFKTFSRNDIFWE